jgi:hypothetical protein
MTRLAFCLLGVFVICRIATGTGDESERIPFNLDAALGGGIVPLGTDVQATLKASVSAATPADLAKWVAKLDEASFPERESASREILKYLSTHTLATRIALEQATKSSSPEIRMRSKFLLQQGEDSQVLNGLMEWIALRKIPGVLPSLDQAPPGLWNQHRSERLPDIVESVATKDDLALLRKWRSHPLPAFRRSAAKALAKLGDTKELTPLAKDSDPYVRLEVALQLGRLSNPQCIDIFKELVANNDFIVRSKSGYALECLTGKYFGFSGSIDQALRDATVKAWREYDISNPHFPLVMPRSILSNAPFGENLYMLTSSPGEIRKYDLNGILKTKEPVPFSGRACDLLPLPGGRFLLAGETEDEEFSWKIIKNGKAIREQKRKTYACPSFLSNGNLLFCEETHAFELDEENREILNIPVSPGSGRNAWRTHYGTTLVASSLGVREHDRNGALVWQSKHRDDFVVCCQGLPNGNVLIVLTRSDRVIEVNREKQIVWEWSSGNRNPRDCFVLPNNNLLVASDRGALEVTRNKKVLWEIKDTNIWQVRRGN